MDLVQAAMLREMLATTGWVDASRRFAASLRHSTRTPGGLLLVGRPDDEPWHLAAHLDDEARLSGVPELAPTLVRWRPPPDAPDHLRVGIERIEAARRGETVFVVTDEKAPPPLLERVSDARGVGATVLSLDAGDAELESLAHDVLSVPPLDVAAAAPMSFELAQHLVSMAAGEGGPAASRRGVRTRLARLLDRISGPAP